MAYKRLSKFEILDCTIRDGGYLNNWDFDPKMVKDLYRQISRTGVDYIELGYRNPGRSSNGIWYHTSEELINELFGDFSGVPIALMVDYGKVDLEQLPKQKESLVAMYRVASHKDKIAGSLTLCQKIKDKGYRTSLQLMGIAGYSENELKRITKEITKSNLDYIYFADSYGSLFPYDIKRYVDILKLTGKKVGFHAHNSLQLAFANTLEAIRNGADIVDGTVYGMGRGSGNLPLEVLIIYLEKTLKNKRYNVMPVLDLIDRYFISLQNQLKWGYELPYMLSGILEVHPNYVSSLVSRHEYDVDDMVKILEVIKESDAIGYKDDLLKDVLSRGFASGGKNTDGPDHDKKEVASLRKKYPVEYVNRHKGRDFLILASGPSLKDHKREIDKFIKRYDPVVMGANYLGGLFKPDYHAFSNKKRFISYIDSVDKDSKILVSSAFDKDFITEHLNREYECMVHLNRPSRKFYIDGDVITSNCYTVSILLIAVAIVMGGRRIFIAGMDGYKNIKNLTEQPVHFYKESQETEDFKVLIEKHDCNESILRSINQYLLSRNREGLHIITPTSHSYFYNSILNWIK